MRLGACVAVRPDLGGIRRHRVLVEGTRGRELVAVVRHRTNWARPGGVMQWTCGPGICGGQGPGPAPAGPGRGPTTGPGAVPGPLTSGHRPFPGPPARKILVRPAIAGRP